MPGYVWVGIRRARSIARYLGIELEAFSRRYLRQVGRRLSLTERADGSCIFLDDDACCTIYPVRPRQCRTFPFWKENLESPEAWKACGECCHGVDQGRRYTRDEIETLADGRGATAGREGT